MSEAQGWREDGRDANVEPTSFMELTSKQSSARIFSTSLAEACDIVRASSPPLLSSAEALAPGVSTCDFSTRA
jgi:hypothetical protein